MKNIPVEISARHVHLSKNDLELLFGRNYNLNIKSELSQQGQFLSEERISIVGPKGEFKDVAIIGPVRDETQVEISVTDSYKLGIETPPVLVSGDLEKSIGGVELVGKSGSIKLTSGVIVAQRHLHLEPSKLKEINKKHKDIVSILVGGDRSVIFNNVIIRSRDKIDNMSFQIDTDEANAAGVKNGDFCEIIE